MMFFQTYWTWLSARLDTYISSHAAQLAAAIEPAVVSMAVISVMLWGYLHLRGQIEEPIMEGATRLLTLIVVFGVGLKLWAYNDLLVDTFFTAPNQLAAKLVGAPDPVTMVDQIWTQGGTAAGLLWSKANILTGDAGFYLMAAAVYVLVAFVCVYTMFLISLARIALAVLLALGPLFIVMTLFQPTRRFFEAWIHELTNYALVSILTMMVTILLLDFVQSYATQTAALGSDLMTVDALNLVLTAGLVLMVLRQVLPIAARLAGGFALSTNGVVERMAVSLGGFAVGTAMSAFNGDDSDDEFTTEDPEKLPRQGGAV